MTDELTNKANDIGRFFIDKAIAEFRRHYCILLDQTESPIEILLGTALFAVLKGHPPEYTWSVCWRDEIIRTNWPPFRIVVQPKIGPYRADFAIQYPGDGPLIKTIVIECDGHDFHEKTKLQAAHDKKRDRWFQTRGIPVLRFTGSEIWADPIGCAEQVKPLVIWRQTAA